MALFFIGFILVSMAVQAQEINASVLIDAEQVQITDKSVLADMKANITQFINTRRWTNDRFSVNERIKMNLNIKLTDMPATGQFTAQAQVQFARPVYGVGYESMGLNFLDKDFSFNYFIGQTIQFNDNSFTDNLSSLIAFYAYFVLGMDYDSFSKLGGSLYFEKAMQVVNNAQQSGFEGWSQLGSNPNSRYWLNENMNSPQFKDFREYSYVYYRNVLDQMVDKPEESRTKAVEMIAILKRINDTKPSSCLLRTYFNTKSDELIKMLSEATAAQKSSAVEMLRAMDPTNTENYEKLLSN